MGSPTTLSYYVVGARGLPLGRTDLLLLLCIADFRSPTLSLPALRRGSPATAMAEAVYCIANLGVLHLSAYFRAVSNLGGLRLRQRKHAELLLREARIGNEKQLGGEHPQTLGSIHNLALLLLERYPSDSSGATLQARQRSCSVRPHTGERSRWFSNTQIRFSLSRILQIC